MTILREFTQPKPQRLRQAMSALKADCGKSIFTQVPPGLTDGESVKIKGSSGDRSRIVVRPFSNSPDLVEVCYYDIVGDEENWQHGAILHRHEDVLLAAAFALIMGDRADAIHPAYGSEETLLAIIEKTSRDRLRSI